MITEKVEIPWELLSVNTDTAVERGERERAIIIIWALAECELGGGAHTINPPPPR